MHYVKHFKINNVDTKQVACIELHGAPNAATEGAVGVLGIDVDSPAREMYRCVGVSGSIYTWKACTIEGANAVIVDILHDMDLGVATASHSASEIWELVKGGSVVIAVRNGEFYYQFNRVEVSTDGKVEGAKFTYTEVSEDNTLVTTYGVTIDESKEVAVWENELEGGSGADGEDGITPVFEVDEVVTLEAGEHAYVDIDNADPAHPRISFGIPKGADGKDGSSADISELEEDVETLKQQMANLLYTAISVTSFTHNAGTKEYGQTVSSVNLSWAINKTPTALTLDGEALDVSLRSKALTGLSITKDKNKTWKLVATDERGAKSEKTTTISFCNGVYYGVGAAQDAYDSAFVMGLTKNLRSNKLTSVTVTAGEGEYIFYCLPKRMGTCTFKVGGFEGGFELVATMSFTNASGYTEDYYIYKSVNANLGKTTVSIS
jgi:hypothetical protein